MKTSADQMLRFNFCLGSAMPITLMLLLPIQGTTSVNVMVFGSIAVCIVADILMPHAVRFDSLLATALLLLRSLDRVHALVEPSLTASYGDHEGVSVTIVEAMASREHVTQRHSRVGRPWGKRIALPAGDMAALASHLLPLIDRPESRPEMGQAAHKIVRDNFALRLRTPGWKSYFRAYFQYRERWLLAWLHGT